MLTACFIVLRHARAGGPQCKISMPMLRAEAVHPLTPQDLANAVLTTYFVVLGTLALTATMLRLAALHHFRVTVLLRESNAAAGPGGKCGADGALRSARARWCRHLRCKTSSVQSD